ncbi:protein rogdi homolog isoform X2 [Anneissia japonica]|uniref:protein rogdi homolog isoform X2 n=1 Tax=Anneissia japonica TaxID=1529436 RepID=UPI001425ABEF|nr:protein rogdi homolog isoform X2 [Anneissia japonica]
MNVERGLGHKPQWITFLIEYYVLWNHRLFVFLSYLACPKGHDVDPVFYSNENTIGSIKAEKFVLQSANGSDHVRGIITLQGDRISKADLTLRLQRSASQILKTSIREDIPWRLQQVQDAGNHLQTAVERVSMKDVDYEFQSGEEVSQLMDEVMCSLHHGRQCLLNPSKETLPDIYRNKSTRSLSPQLPPEAMINFFIHCNKLVMVAYYIHQIPPSRSTQHHRPQPILTHPKQSNIFEVGAARFEVTAQYLVESVVPWLSETLMYFTVALQTCQELKNKIEVFASYQEDKQDN